MFTLTHKGKKYVIMNMSAEAANVALDAIGELMNGGSIEILSGEGSPLAVLRLSDPAAMPAFGNELEFNEITEEDSAFANGTATAARIVGRDGSEVFTCDCGDEDSDAVIKLSSAQISLGGSVQISSFRIAMP